MQYSAVEPAVRQEAVSGPGGGLFRLGRPCWAFVGSAPPLACLPRATANRPPVADSLRCFRLARGLGPPRPSLLPGPGPRSSAGAPPRSLSSLFLRSPLLAVPLLFYSLLSLLPPFFSPSLPPSLPLSLSLSLSLFTFTARPAPLSSLLFSSLLAAFPCRSAIALSRPRSLAPHLLFFAPCAITYYQAIRPAFTAARALIHPPARQLRAALHCKTFLRRPSRPYASSAPPRPSHARPPAFHD